MKFTTVVIIEASEPSLDNIRKKLPELSKTYPPDSVIKSASLIAGTNMSDNYSIAKSLAKLTGQKSGVDEKGVYLMSELFKKGIIKKCLEKIDKPLMNLKICDYYEEFDLDMTDNLLSYIDEYDRFPDAILMPDLSLIRAEGELGAWKDAFKKTLKPYSKTSLALILDCHC